jgi:hypothetical protein
MERCRNITRMCLDLTNRSVRLKVLLQVGETGSASAEGATAPETLRQKDRLPRNTLKSGAFRLSPTV